MNFAKDFHSHEQIIVPSQLENCMAIVPYFHIHIQNLCVFCKKGIGSILAFVVCELEVGRTDASTQQIVILIVFVSGPLIGSAEVYVLGRGGRIIGWIIERGKVAADGSGKTFTGKVWGKLRVAAIVGAHWVFII